MILLQSPTPLSSAEIGSRLEITPRAVRYSLRAIEKWLEARGVLLIKKPKYGIFIDAPSRVKRDLMRELEHLKGCPLILSPSERLHMIVLALLTSEQPLLAKRLKRQLCVSRPTVLKDLERAEAWLTKHNLSLIRRPHFGFKALGSESDWRHAIVDFLLETAGEMPLLALSKGSEEALRSRMKGQVGLLRNLRSFLQNLDLGYSAKLVNSVERMLHLQFTDNAYVSLLLHLAILIWRVQQGKIVELLFECIESLREQREFCAARVMGKQIEHTFNIALPESEIAYIAMQLLGAKTKRAISDIIGERDAEKMDPEVLEIVHDMLAEASCYLHPYLRVDQQLIRSLAFHPGNNRNPAKTKNH